MTNALVIATIVCGVAAVVLLMELRIRRMQQKVREAEQERDIALVRAETARVASEITEDLHTAQRLNEERLESATADITGETPLTGPLKEIARRQTERAEARRQ